MKLRSVFVTDRRQIEIPKGWKIDTVVSTTPPSGKPQWQVLLRKDDEQDKQSGIGFKR